MFFKRNLALSTKNLMKWMQIKNINCWRMFFYRTDRIQWRQLTLCVAQFGGGPLGSWGPKLTSTQPIGKSGLECTQPTCDYSKTNFTVLCVSYNFTVRRGIKTRRALGLPQATMFLHKAFKTLVLAVPATETVEFCAVVYLNNERIVTN